jgi:UDP-N-acetylmuramoyl-L-alanyl-D-glutamate--2,6-diaminopimelate ligase
MALTRLKSADAAARWLKEWVTGTLRSDSRLVQAGDAFIAWPGYAVDGRRFARAALAAGAATSLVEHEGVEAFSFEDARIASLPQLKAQTGVIADAYFGHPSAALDVVATTGTNGKTSTAWWTAQALTLLGRRCGVIGTLGVGEPDRLQFTGLTTPDPVRLHAALRRFVDEDFKACAIEASSIGIVEHRLAGLRVAVALFTNFTRDHLDYHGTMEAYWHAKQALFGWPGLRAAVVNLDDEKGAALAAGWQGNPLDLWTYAVERPARLTARAVSYTDGGLTFDVAEQGGNTQRVQSRLIGDYNVSNLLAVVGGLRALGIPLADAARIVPQLTPVPGRLQRVGGGAPEVVVDYAHTPDALEKVLAALRPLAAARGGALWCVFGCGGDRDASKRPLMGGIAQRGADRVIVTSDNPRSEAPMAILKQIAAGMQGATLVEDRSAAIAQAVRDADASDVILVAGKGHEDYQEVAGVKHLYSDVEQAQIALQARAAS